MNTLSQNIETIINTIKEEHNYKNSLKLFELLADILFTDAKHQNDKFLQKQLTAKAYNLLNYIENNSDTYSTNRNNKVIGKSFNAKLVLYPNKETKELLNSLDANLGQIFIVSQFELGEGEGEFKFPNLSIDVLKADGETCERCWQVVEHTHDGICERCAEVIK